MARQPSSNNSRASTAPQTLRIDKWLWAARFYKTRSLASDAIKSGRVLVNDEKAKPSKEIAIGDTLSIRQSYFSKTVIIVELSARRGPAAVAAALYQETAESILNRERLKEIQQAQPALRRTGQGRPTKRERRHIISFTQKGKF
ncbi:MAG: RNA-binding S4 domain-containing protein [Gammaproteobacteria bacterium]|nr:RNA-binding S4 domain-containing protein [Gammaproteobacteria bacterium]